MVVWCPTCRVQIHDSDSEGYCRSLRHPVQSLADADALPLIRAVPRAQRAALLRTHRQAVVQWARRQR